MFRRPTMIAIWAVACPAAAAGPRAEPAGRGQQTVPSHATASGPVLRIARSADGLDFADTGEVFLRNAWWPAMVRLPNGRLLAVFQHARTAGTDRGSALAAACSRDDGRTWLPPQPVRLHGPLADASWTGPAELTLMPSGLVRLYLSPGDRERGSIVSAVTRDGLTYQYDPELRAPLGRAASGPVTVFQGPRQFQMIAATGMEADRGPAGHPLNAIMLTSGDGRRFRLARRLPLPGPICDVVRGRGGEYRMYVAVNNEIRSMISPDAARWREEPAARLRGASDAAVVQLGDGGYLMLYCTRPDQRSAGAPEQALASAAGQTADVGDSPATKEAWNPFTEAGLETELGEAAGSEAAQASAGCDNASHDPFAPLPDFANPFDYVNWYEESFVPPPGENAFEGYAELLSPENVELIGGLNDMFNGDYDGLPGPWDPADHPEWEASHHASRDLLDAFRDNCLDPRAYGNPAQFGTDSSDGGSAAEQPSPLLNIVLPSLANYRRLCRATLANSWRMEDGAVSPEGMREAWTTVFGNAAHVEQGACLIEGLVGLAERTQAQENARWALHHGVFESAEQVEAALAVLQEHDRSQADPGRWMRLEHAFMMDTTQHLFGSAENGGVPTADRARIERYAESLGLDEEGIEELTNLPPERIQEAIETADQHYRELAGMFKKDYAPGQVDQMEKLAEQRALSNPLLKHFIPSLARVYRLHTRGEASRRATQLAYGVHSFKLRHGRWPATLDELPPEHRDHARTDPFTGADFGYRLTPGGPTIYSSDINGVDDGGIHNPDRRDETIESDDYVFWPPRRR